MSAKDLIKGSTHGLAVDSRLLPIIAILWPIFTRMSAVPHPMHLIRVITDSMITVEENLQRIDHQQQQLATGLTAMHHDLLAEITRLQEQITQLEAHSPKKSPLWWPWRR